MKTFKDAKGDEWTLTMTLGAAMAIRDQLKLDLLKPPDGAELPPVARLSIDDSLLAEVLRILLEPQFEAKSTTVEQVRYAFDGAALLAAHTALYEELILFFQSRGRPDQAGATAKLQAAVAKGIEAAAEEIERMDVDKIVETEIRGAVSGALPAALASTPGPSR